MRSGWILVTALCVGCSRGELVTWNGPPLFDAKAALLVAEGVDGSRWARAFARPIGAPITVPVTEVDPVRMDALLYACPLGAVGLEAGAVSLSSEAGGDPVPPADEFASSLWDGAQRDWVFGPAPAEISDLRLQVGLADACQRFGSALRIENIALPGSEGASGRFFARLSQKSALIGLGKMDGSTLLYVLEDGEPPLVTQVVDAPPRLAGVVVREDGELLLVDNRGQVQRGDLERGFTPFGAPAGGSFTRRIEGAPSGPIEIWSFNDGLVLERFDGAQWSVVTTVPAVGSVPPRLIWVGPGEVYALGSREELPEIIHVLDGVARHEPLQPRATSFFLHPKAGVIAGLGDSTLVAHTPRHSWSPYLQQPLPLPARAMALFGDALLIATEFRLLYYHPRAGLCSAELTVSDPHEALAFGDGALLLRGSLSSANAPYLIEKIVAEHPPASCVERVRP